MIFPDVVRLHAKTLADFRLGLPRHSLTGADWCTSCAVGVSLKALSGDSTATGPSDARLKRHALIVWSGSRLLAVRLHMLYQLACPGQRGHELSRCGAEHPAPPFMCMAGVQASGRGCDLMHGLGPSFPSPVCETGVRA